MAAESFSSSGPVRVKVGASSSATVVARTDRVLIVSILSNDDDGEMLAMTDAIEKYEIARPDVLGVDRLDYQADIAKAKKKQLPCKSKNYDVLLITGHSRFFPPEAALWGSKKPVAIAPAERLIGGEAPAVAADIITQAIVDYGVRWAGIMSCEVALDTDTWDSTAECQDERFVDFETYEALLEEVPVRLSEDPGRVSTLALVAQDVVTNLRSSFFYEPFTLAGMHGAGYLSPADPRPKTFDQRYLHDAAKVSEAARNLARAKPKDVQKLKSKLDEADAAMLGHVEEKRFAHLLCLRFNGGWKDGSPRY